MPIVRGFRATNVWKAFILASFVTSLIAVGAVETRRWLSDNWLKDHTEVVKALATFGVTFLVAIIAYIVMYFLFHYGDV